MSKEAAVPKIEKIRSKLKISLASGNYYEAHQMYRILYYRYLGQENYNECLNLLFHGALKLLDERQHAIAVDLAILVVETLKKSKRANYSIWMKRLGYLIAKTSSNNVDRDTLVNSALKWTGEISDNSMGHPLMHGIIARIMKSEQNFERARHHYMLSGDGTTLGKMLVSISQQKAFPCEVDLVIVQALLQLLCIQEVETATKTFEAYTRHHPQILTTKPPFHLPLLNFAYFLLKLVEIRNVIMFRYMCRVYQSTLSRDPVYEVCLRKIAEIYFGVTSQQKYRIGMFGDFISRLFDNVDEGDAEDAMMMRNSSVNELD